MNDISIGQLTPKQLRQAAKLKEQILELEQELRQLLGGARAAAPSASAPAKRKRKMSAAAKARMSEAAKKRWAKAKAAGKSRL